MFQFFLSNQSRPKKIRVTQNLSRVKMSAENSETETRPENDVSAVNLFVQNLLTTVALAVLKGIMSEFQCWTGRLTEIVQLGWNGFLHAFYLSFDVLRFTLMEAIKILISGSQQVYLLTGLFRMAFILIFNIFKGALWFEITLFLTCIRSHSYTLRKMMSRLL